MFKRTHYTTNPNKAGPKNTHLVTETGEPKEVYLICADDYHYIGSTERDVAERLREHALGHGCAFTAWLVGRGHKLALARVWHNVDGSVEFRLKAWGGTRRCCPLCSGEAAYNRARYDEYIIQPADAPAEELAF